MMDVADPTSEDVYHWQKDKSRRGVNELFGYTVSQHIESDLLTANGQGACRGRERKTHQGSSSRYSFDLLAFFLHIVSQRSIEKSTAVITLEISDTEVTSETSSKS